jgi:hypothetical protein
MTQVITSFSVKGYFFVPVFYVMNYYIISCYIFKVVIWKKGNKTKAYGTFLSRTFSLRQFHEFTTTYENIFILLSIIYV